MAGREPPSTKEPANSPPKRRAVEYVRMSTDHQKYSTENQSDAIRRYAEERGFELVRSYADAGKSGLRIEGRARWPGNTAGNFPTRYSSDSAA